MSSFDTSDKARRDRSRDGAHGDVSQVTSVSGGHHTGRHRDAKAVDSDGDVDDARGGSLVRGEQMGEALRVTLEVGPKNKKVVAVAPDWPGLERGAKTGEAAIERLWS